MPIENDHPGPAPSQPAIRTDAIELAYRPGPLVADYLRAGAGLGLTLAPLLLLSLPAAVRLGLAGLVLLFALFLAQTWRRQRQRVLLSSEGIALIGVAPRRLAWRDLDRLRLRWFGARQQEGRGWLELELRGGGQRLAVTSALDRFDMLVAEAAHAASVNGLALDPATRANLVAATRAGRDR